MKRLLILTFAVAAVSMMAETSADAQVGLSINQGYQFGTGVHSARRSGANFNRGFIGGFSNIQSREQLPYFAKFPPVYYSHIVKRPYGISPFAAPSGIAPVEMSFEAPIPLSVKNPFYEKGMAPAKSASPKTASKTKMKTT